MFKVVKNGAAVLAGGAAISYLAILIHAVLDGPGGATMPHEVSHLLNAAGCLAAIAVTAWLVEYQVNGLKTHVDAVDEHRKNETRQALREMSASLLQELTAYIDDALARLQEATHADTEQLLRNEITQVLPRIETDNLEKVRAAFRDEVNRATRETADRAVRGVLAARGTAAVPTARTGNILPIRSGQRLLGEEG